MFVIWHIWYGYFPPNGNAREVGYFILESLLIGAGFFGVFNYVFSFRHECSFVGTHGVARFKLKKSLNAKPTVEILLFEKAADLRTGSTRHFVNGIYSGTSYFHTWTDKADRKRFGFKGKYHSREGTPKVDDPYWLAASAERAWTQYKVAEFEHHLEKTGYVSFTYGGGNEVRVGPGFFEFVVKGQPNHIAVEDIKHIQLINGQFYIQHKEARWFSGKGKFNFPYETLTNAQAFLYVMGKLTGYRFG